MSALTPEDVANVIKLLERLRTGEMNLIPSLATAEPRDPNGKSEAMLQRVEDLLSAHLRRMQEPVGDGGAAFPRDQQRAPDGDLIAWEERGMSLRDYFAGEALQGIMVNAVGLGQMNPEERSALFAATAGLLYEIADAMLKARQP